VRVLESLEEVFRLIDKIKFGEIALVEYRRSFIPEFMTLGLLYYGKSRAVF
jgi:hypothetical protein